MAIAELFLATFITVLFEKLASPEFIRLARSAGISSKVQKLKNILPLIQAVLADAAEKQITNTSVQLWLNKLQHLAYEIDDVLDDLTTEAMRHQLDKKSDASNNTSKVLKFIPTKFQAFKYGLKMSSKLDDVTTKLGDLVEEKKLLGLTDNVVMPNRAATRKPREQTSLLPTKDVIGRKSDKEVLLGKLLGDESSTSQNVSVVSIIGMAGIGKTTLAELLYNDEKVKNHFELKSWVCISDEFDVFKISQAIFQAVGGGNQDFANLNLLHEALKEKLSKKRFLIVLDDVWNEDYNKWERLQRPFTVGAPKSKILVTTQKAAVASMMESVQRYHLELLSDEDALSLFAQHASGEQNFDVNRTLKLHGEVIIKKCGNLPLALRALGRVFRTKSNVEEWMELLNSELWNSQNGSEILPALRLSYYDLPPHLKQMFAYCCLFPKDYMFDKDELVLLWMAEGFFCKLNGNQSMENFGQKCFEELVSRSFFMHSANKESGYMMHDLVNDLAINVAGEFFFTLDDKMDVYGKDKALETSHHVSVIRAEYEMYPKFKALHRARNLRTFIAVSVELSSYFHSFYLSDMVLVKLLPQLFSVRVLSLAKYQIKEVPESIGSLKHLRYLNFSRTRIKCLPEQVGDLYNLQSLLLSGCYELSSLPNSIVQLINLRHLDISDTRNLNKMPLGIGGLTGLQTLSKVIIGEAHEFKISDLKGMLHLQGQLSIKGLHKVQNAAQAREAKLQQKKSVYDLEMEWSDAFNGSRNEITEYQVLEGLRPFENLKSLKIVCYSGTKFPSWVGDHSFECLTELTLRDCRSCTCLPTLGHLPSLQKLFVRGMYGLKSLGLEFLGPSDSCHSVAFPSLEVLEFEDMKEWEEWSTGGCDKSRIFPCLRKVSIIKCPKLDVVAMEFIPSLQDLNVNECSLAVLRTMVGVSSSIARLKIENIEGLTQLHGKVLQHLKAVEYLSISSCGKLTYLWESDAEAYKICGGLQKLVPFTQVIIEDCQTLKGYNCPNNIEKLVIRGCGSVTSLSFPAMDGTSSSLKLVKIWKCNNMEVSWLDNKFLSSLESLGFWNMPKLRLFPEGCLVHLTKLTIFGCHNIECIPDNGYGFLPYLCMREIVIYECQNLKSFPHEHLQNLTSLEHMKIVECPCLNFPFPSGLWPPKLRSLEIGYLKKPISEWGLQNFPTSLVELRLHGGENSGVVSFAAKPEEEEEDISSFLLPLSLTHLHLWDFKELESVSEGLQHLTCLKHLYIHRCHKLRDLPKTLLPSLSSLCLSGCSPVLEKKCSRRRKGKYWPIISQTPQLWVPDLLS